MGVIKMNWKDILKFDDMMRETWREFGGKLIDILKSTGFEVKSAYHVDEDVEDYHKQHAKIRPYTHMTEEEEQYNEGMGAYGHELIITDREEPFVSSGYGTATLTIKYIEDNYVRYNNPRNEDIPHKRVTDFKIEEVSMTTGAKRNIDVKMDMGNIDNSQSGLRDFLQRILEVFKEYAAYEEDYGDMSEEEIREERGARAGRRYAGGAWSAGYRQNVWDDY